MIKLRGIYEYRMLRIKRKEKPGCEKAVQVRRSEEKEINTKFEFMMFGAAAMPLLCCALPIWD